MQQPWIAISTLLDFTTMVRPTMPNGLFRNSFKRKLHRTIVEDLFEDKITVSQQFAWYGFAHVSAVVTSPPHTYGVGGSLCHQPQLPQLWYSTPAKRVFLDTRLGIANYTMLMRHYKAKTAVQSSRGDGQTTANITLGCQKQLLSWKDLLAESSNVERKRNSENNFKPQLHIIIVGSVAAKRASALPS